jgi:hypothetical protein
MFAIESEFYFCQIAQTAGEQCRAKYDQQRKSHLGHHQKFRGADAEASRPGVRRRFHDRAQFHLGGAKRRGQAEQQAGCHRERDGERQHMPVSQ